MWRSRMLVPLVVALAGTAVSSVAITTPSVWFDEAATVSGATRSIPELLHMLGKVDAVHGLYYGLMHVVFGAVGYSPLSLRLVSALAVGVTTALVVVLDRQLRPGSYGIVAGVVFCLLPRVTWMGGEGRSFALTALAAGILSLVLLLALRRRSVLPWVLYAVVAVIGCTLFVYFALVIVAHGVSVALKERRALLPWALASVGAGVTLVPFAMLIVTQGSQLPSMPEFDSGTVREVLVGQWFGTSVPLAILAGILLALGARNGWLALPALTVPTLAILAGGLANPELYQARYLGMIAPFVALGMAAGIATIPWRPVGVVTVALVVGLGAAQLALERSADAKKDTSWARVAAIIAQERAGDRRASGVVFGELAPHTSATARVIAIAYPDAFEGLRDITIDQSGAEVGELWSAYSPLDPTSSKLLGLNTVLLLGTDTAADATLLQGAGFTLERTWDEVGVQILELRR